MIRADDESQRRWINAVGGLGDTLMLSGVLKHVHDRDPSRQFNLIRRTNYLAILKGHPALAQIGYPPRDAVLARTDYWGVEELGPGERRAYQVLARMFGLPTPVEELLFAPGGLHEDPLLWKHIPWRERNILIVPKSTSPRKEMHPSRWHRLVELLLQNGAFVAQSGKRGDVHIRNAYSLLGLTNQREFISLIKQFDLVISSDSFAMHAAYMVGTAAAVIWGPTHHEIYGYPGQLHLQCPKPCDGNVKCIGPSQGNEPYVTPCPLGREHCMDQIPPEAIHDAIVGFMSDKRFMETLEWKNSVSLNCLKETPSLHPNAAGRE